MEDYEIDYDATCPHCNHSPIHHRNCTELACNDGYEDEYYDDPINFYPGESFIQCSACKGTSVEVWCPGCGVNLSGNNVLTSDEDEDW